MDRALAIDDGLASERTHLRQTVHLVGEVGYRRDIHD
ncbi:MAG: hypothetical protein AVDCRST_MAG05-4187 [uncultured Rubrobacteraceae bacterium]|uniref:Uncharacterized protein n=1 Tax=uncultured Rubrobacteraceae bacterium TaxID=349277 RepID=A0A6J4TNR5_9ACTN|nr:MAG: hypothetical protein AVDCRST_MAG05-4187 [uncultured Rubrobacteraceae bacterium]